MVSMGLMANPLTDIIPILVVFGLLIWGLVVYTRKLLKFIDTHTE